MFGHFHSKKDFNYITHAGVILSNSAFACLFLVANSNESDLFAYVILVHQRIL